MYTRSAADTEQHTLFTFSGYSKWLYRVMRYPDLVLKKKHYFLIINYMLLFFIRFLLLNHPSLSIPLKNVKRYILYSENKLFSTLAILVLKKNLEYQMDILEGFLKDHVTLKTRVMR